MIVLDSTTKLLQIILSGAVTTNQLQFSASYADYVATPAAFTPGANSGLTNNTTAVTLVGAPAASTQRQVKRINVYNADTAPATVTIRLSDAGNFRTQLSVTLQVGERIEYEDAEGFRVFTVTGAVKVTAVQSTVEPGYIDGLTLRYDATNGFSVLSGTCYIPSVGANVNFPSTVSKAGITISASTMYHVYAFLNAGAPDVEHVTTAPSTPYNGSARTKTGDTSRRYLGSFLTNASSQIIKFAHNSAGLMDYLTALTPSSIFNLGDTAVTTPTTFSAAAVTPTTATHVRLNVSNNTNQFVVMGSSDQVPAFSGSSYMQAGSPNTIINMQMILDGSRAFVAQLLGVPPSASCGFIAIGYVFTR